MHNANIKRKILLMYRSLKERRVRSSPCIWTKMKVLVFLVEYYKHFTPGHLYTFRTTLKALFCFPKAYILMNSIIYARVYDSTYCLHNSRCVHAVVRQNEKYHYFRFRYVSQTERPVKHIYTLLWLKEEYLLLLSNSASQSTNNAQNEYKYHAVFLLVLFPWPRERLKTLVRQNFGKKKTKGAGERKQI